MTRAQLDRNWFLQQMKTEITLIRQTCELLQTTKIPEHRDILMKIYQQSLESYNEAKCKLQ